MTFDAVKMSTSDFSGDVPLTTTIPTGKQVPYIPPSIPALLSLSAFLVLLALPTLLSNSYPVFAFQPKCSPEGGSSKAASNRNTSTKSQIHSYNLDASLTIIFPLLLGALFGPSITSNAILSTSTQCTLINIGYIGLILLIFEAGVALDPASLKLMRDNAALSTLVALNGALVPIALSMGLGMGAYGYGGLQAFASGASLASTSLGTTLALLAPTSTAPVTSESEKERTPDMDLRRTRVGCVLVCAALLDDILGLVIAGIIPGLAQTGAADSPKVQWSVIVRPVLVSVAFGLGTPLAAIGLRWAIHRFISKATPRPQFLVLFIISVLMAFVAGSGYSGTSELFGAYLAGAFVSHVFPAQDDAASLADDSVDRMSSPDILQDGNIAVKDDDGSGNPSLTAFGAYIQPILTHLLAPLFFGSIGVALPIKEMFTTHPDAVQIATTVQAGERLSDGSDEDNTYMCDSTFRIGQYYDYYCRFRQGIPPGHLARPDIFITYDTGQDGGRVLDAHLARAKCNTRQNGDPKQRQTSPIRIHTQRYRICPAVSHIFTAAAPQNPK